MLWDVEMSNKHLLIVGTGGLGKVILNCAVHSYSKITFMTNDKETQGIADYNIIFEQDVSIDYIKDNFDELFVAIGDNKTRHRISLHYMNLGIKLATIIHPDASVSQFSHINPGTTIAENAVVGPFASIGSACFIAPSSVVCHDCKLENGARTSPKAAIGGGCEIGENTWLCMGSIVSDHVKIGKNCVIGASALVLNDVPDNALMVGIPAAVKKYYEEK